MIESVLIFCLQALLVIFFVLICALQIFCLGQVINLIRFVSPEIPSLIVSLLLFLICFTLFIGTIYFAPDMWHEVTKEIPNEVRNPDNWSHQ